MADRGPFRIGVYVQRIIYPSAVGHTIGPVEHHHDPVETAFRFQDAGVEFIASIRVPYGERSAIRGRDIRVSIVVLNADFTT